MRETQNVTKWLRDTKFSVRSGPGPTCLAACSLSLNADMIVLMSMWVLGRTAGKQSQDKWPYARGMLDSQCWLLVVLLVWLVKKHLATITIKQHISRVFHQYIISIISHHHQQQQPACHVTSDPLPHPQSLTWPCTAKVTESYEIAISRENNVIKFISEIDQTMQICVWNWHRQSGFLTSRLSRFPLLNTNHWSLLISSPTLAWWRRIWMKWTQIQFEWHVIEMEMCENPQYVDHTKQLVMVWWTMVDHYATTNPTCLYTYSSIKIWIVINITKRKIYILYFHPFRQRTEFFTLFNLYCLLSIFLS